MNRFERGFRTSLTAACALLATVGAVTAGAAAPGTVPPPGAAAPPFVAVDQPDFASPGPIATAWADFDNDGDLDLAVGYDTGEIRLYRNDKGVFTNVGSLVGLPTSGPGEIRGLAWGDYDGDGYIDLYATRAGRGGGIGRGGAVVVNSSLYHNIGGKSFVDVAEAMGVANVGPSGRQPTWIDYDNDGDLDLYVTQRYTTNRLLRNDGDHFTDVSAASGLNDPRRSVGACWFDFDGDGDLDVFVANQQGDKDGFYRNDGGKFVDIAPELGMDQSQRTVDTGGVSCAVGDYDNDGRLDLFVSTYGQNLIYHNEGNGHFKEVAASLGVTGDKHTVGAGWGDYDNDGLLDLYVTGYTGETETTRAKDYLFHNEGGKLVDVLGANSPLHAADHGISWADFDQDGDLDLVLAQTWGKATRLSMFRNELPKARRESSLQVMVLNSRGIATRAGAEVRLFDAQGKLLGTRLVGAGHSYASQSVMPVHFGLAKNAPVTVEVTFMTREGRKTQTVKNVDPRQYVGKALIVTEVDAGAKLVAEARAAQPQHTGTLQLSGLHKQVEVTRDKWGIPHIYASDTHDLFFAQGFVAAQDRMWNMEIWRRNAEGKLAEVLGPKFVNRDKFARIMKYRGDWDTEFRRYHPQGPLIFSSFADGVNAAIRTALEQGKVPVEFERSGFQPEPVWTAQTLVSRMPIWSITKNISSEVARALSVKQIGLEKTQETLATDPPTPLVLPQGLDLEDINANILDVTRDANDFGFRIAANVAMQPAGARFASTDSAVQRASELGIGSNNWVVSGKKTTTGMPLLANDPHREVQNPALRYWVHLVAPGWNAIGITEPGMPGVTVGHNDKVAWGFTILNGDQQDLYVEHLNPGNPNEYLYKGKWETMRVDREDIAVKGAPTEQFQVRTTRHGPLLSEDRARSRGYAMRWSGYEPGGQGYLGSLSLMQATNWEDFTQRAADSWYGNHSLVYADVQGNYGYVSTGLTPKRPNWDGLFPVPGHEGKYEWDGYVPTRDLPKSLNSPKGFYTSSNNNVFPEIFPGQAVPAFTREYLSPYRNQRLLEVLGADRKFSLADLQKLQGDVVTLPARELVPLLKDVSTEKPELKDAIHRLLSWNYSVDVDSVAAAIYEYWQPRLNPLTYAHKLPEAARAGAKYDMRTLVRWLQNPDADFGPEPRVERNRILLVALEQALEALKKLAGPDPNRWQWGALHQARFIHPLESNDTAALTRIAPVPRSGDNFTVQLTNGVGDQTIGASAMFVFDVQDWDRSVGLNAPGNETQLGSAHYADLAARWGRNEAFPVAFSRKKVQSGTTERLTLRP